MSTKATPLSLPALEAVFHEQTGLARAWLVSSSGINRITPEFAEDMQSLLRWMRVLPGLRGLILASRSPHFCVGAHLEYLYRQRDQRELERWALDLNRAFRGLETAGVPVVAKIEGSALGGGFALALACHRRLVLDDPSVRLGVPGVKMGLLPTLGSTQRLPRLVGMEAASRLLLDSRVLNPRQALEAGLVHQLLPDADALDKAAVEWLRSGSAPFQPWDEAGYSFPPPAPDSRAGRKLMLAIAARLHRESGDTAAAAQATLRAIQEGSRQPLDMALELESRLFARTTARPQTRDMLRTLWFHRKSARRMEGLPKARQSTVSHLGLVGAGLLTSGLARLAARQGLRVSLWDFHPARLERAHAYWQACAKADARQNDDGDWLQRIETPREQYELAECDVVVLASQKALPELRQQLGRLAHDTQDHCTLLLANAPEPLASICENRRWKKRVLGLGIPSSPEQGALVEFWGSATAARLGRALALMRRLDMVPLVVADVAAQYATRLKATYVVEALQMLQDGIHPSRVEWAGIAAGMATSPLLLADTIGMPTLRRAMGSLLTAPGGGRFRMAGVSLLDRVHKELHRPGRAWGRGFYEYRAGNPTGLWGGLGLPTPGDDKSESTHQLSRRFLLVQAAEAARALNDGIVKNERDADLGAVLGAGFAAGTGGPLAWMDSQGLPALVGELESMVGPLGERFAPAPILGKMAQEGRRFYGEDSREGTHEDVSTAPVSG